MKKSDKLLRFTLDDGTGTDRQILSGIHKWYKPEDLVGKTLVAIVNLPPRKMMGLESCGMLPVSYTHLDVYKRQRLLKLWEGLGYYSRARNLQKAAKVIVSDFGGELPRTCASLKTLPGIGDYTAAAGCAPRRR